MPGVQPELWGECAWCGLPAVGEVEISPPVVRKRPDGSTRLIRRATVARACDDHIGILVHQPPDTTNFRRKKAMGVQQLEMFDRAGGSGVWGV